VVLRDEDGILGVDSRSKLIHAVVATPANVADGTVVPDLLHSNETRVWGDLAYRGQRLVISQWSGTRYCRRDLSVRDRVVHRCPTEP
jgi:IS5 family transposase